MAMRVKVGDGVRTASMTADVTRSELRAFRILHVGFTVLPILMGVDKFFNLTTNWTTYVAPVFSNSIPATTLLPIVGVIEIAAGLVVWFKPQIGAYVVAAWLLGIIGNLLLVSEYYDVALRDFGLLLAALALGLLSKPMPNGKISNHLQLRGRE